jgi:cell division control protein 7
MGTIHEPATYLLSHHSSNPLQVPSDDSLNASYVAQLRPLLDAEKARAAKGLAPKTSSTPSAHVSVSDEAGVMDGPGDVTFRPSEQHEHNSCAPAGQLDQLNSAAPQHHAEAGDGDDGVNVQLEGLEGAQDAFDSQLDTTVLPDHAAEDGKVMAICEENSIMFRDPEDRAQVEAEMRDLESAVPRILRDYRLLDRLGEGMQLHPSLLKSQVGKYACVILVGTFSTVYKALDKAQDAQFSGKWHPPIVPRSARAFVALKRIYVTSSPQRIANELSILEECRECRNVSRLLTAFRYRDQVVAVMSYVPNQDFRVRVHFVNLIVAWPLGMLTCGFRTSS